MQARSIGYNDLPQLNASLTANTMDQQLPHEHETFMKEIVASPYDDMPRLIYADWLDEHSNPRGEFIRVQCELANIDPLSGDYHDLNVRNLELQGEYREQWLDEVRLDTHSRRFFERGFIRLIKLPADDLYKYKDSLPPLTPITVLWLTHVDATNEDVGTFPCLSHVHDLRLEITWGEKKAAAIRSIVNSPHLTRLENLSVNLRNADFGPSAIDMLERVGEKLKTLSLFGGRARYTPSKRKLDFSNLQRLELHAAWELAATFRAPRLTSLAITGAFDSKPNGIGQLPLDQLASMDLTNCNDAACETLLSAGAFAKLQRLSLKNCSLSTSGSALLSAGGLNVCNELEITKTNNTVETGVGRFVPKLVDHPLAGRLEKLAISGLDAEASTTLLSASLPLKELAISLSEIPNAPAILRDIAPSLRSLTITDSNIGGLSGVEFPSLRRLEIRRCQLGAGCDGPMAHLLNSLELPELVELRLVDSKLGDRTLMALAQTARCPNLRMLDFGSNTMTPKHIGMILNSERLPLLRRLRMPVNRQSAAIKKLKSSAGAKLQTTERNEAGVFG